MIPRIRLALLVLLKCLSRVRLSLMVTLGYLLASTISMVWYLSSVIFRHRWAILMTVHLMHGVENHLPCLFPLFQCHGIFLSVMLVRRVLSHVKHQIVHLLLQTWNHQGRLVIYGWLEMNVSISWRHSAVALTKSSRMTSTCLPMAA